ncbi:MAG: helix-turn-helix domain-containing protein [Clostridiales bacterium]|nr:helix-turn-helix domain-containing protein [Clostridiales bacterium]
MANYHLKDERLSLKAVGLLSKILSLPEDWDFSVRGLAGICKEGKDGIAATLTELERAGYLERRQLRDSNGKLGGYEYIFRESPYPGFPDTVKPDTAQPDTENPDNIKYYSNQVLSKSSTKGGADAPTPRQQKKFIPPTVEEVEAYCRENGYQIDAQLFVDHYQANGWMRGKNKIKDWRACARTWVRRQNEQANQSGKPTPSQPELITPDNWED